jgi:hypothetical protein
MSHAMPIVDEKILKLKVSNPYRRRPLEKHPNLQLKEQAWHVEKTHMEQTKQCEEFDKELAEIKKLSNTLTSDIG